MGKESLELMKSFQHLQGDLGEAVYIPNCIH
jgi:hypothetical protein